ncbi:hypothetical protein JKP88DRAFT_262132 [Tribonema minus]|uniref:Uncharacterized protein n=1 Tax=Tribonema minus TaxID=303371 RepID=A0A835Z8Q2_9STRA|nr:hypothetical protein JKP88DRAFT_262132 [Tribonema minus]
MLEPAKLVLFGGIISSTQLSAFLQPNAFRPRGFAQQLPTARLRMSDVEAGIARIGQLADLPEYAWVRGENGPLSGGVTPKQLWNLGKEEFLREHVRGREVTREERIRLLDFWTTVHNQGDAEAAPPKVIKVVHESGLVYEHLMPDDATLRSMCPDGLIRLDQDNEDLPLAVHQCLDLQDGATYCKLGSFSVGEQWRQHEKRFKHRDRAIVQEAASAVQMLMGLSTVIQEKKVEVPLVADNERLVYKYGGSFSGLRDAFETAKRKGYHPEKSHLVGEFDGLGERDDGSVGAIIEAKSHVIADDVMKGMTKLKLFHLYHELHKPDVPKDDPPVILCGKFFPHEQRNNALSFNLHVLVPDGSDWRFFSGKEL